MRTVNNGNNVKWWYSWWTTSEVPQNKKFVSRLSSHQSPPSSPELSPLPKGKLGHGAMQPACAWQGCTLSKLNLAAFWCGSTGIAVGSPYVGSVAVAKRSSYGREDKKNPVGF